MYVCVLCIYISIELPNALSVLLLLLCVFFSLSLAYAHGTAQHITPSPPTAAAAAAAAAILQQDVLLPIICRHVLAKPKLLCISYTVTRKSIRRLLLQHQQLILHTFIKLKRKKDTAKKKIKRLFVVADQRIPLLL